MKRRGPFIRRLPALLRGEDGFALVFTLAISVALGITVTAVADYTFSNTRSSSDSYARQLAYGAAESGMNAGLSALYNSGSYHSKIFGDQSAPASLAANPRYTVSYTWTATVTDPIWTVTATGKVLNVTGGTKAVTKTLKRTLRVQAAAGGQGVNPTVWNYIYADAPPGNCMQLSNNALISAPLYVRGDLCLSNNAAVTQNATFTSLYPSTPQLQVGGTVTIGNNGYIGTSGSRLNAVQTGAGCGSPAHNPCTTGDGVWATSYVTTPPTFTKPVIDLATWYNDAAPGPKHACTSSTGSPPAFDNNGVQDNSLGNVNLTPAGAYDCKFTDALGNLLGELKWTPGTPGTLLVTGTVFFDGSLYLTNNVTVVYQGRSTMYFAGNVTFDNNAYICGIAACTASWDTNANLLVLVAGGNVSLTNNAQFQGCVEAGGNFYETNNVGTWGSIIANQVYLSNNANDHYVPFGTPVPGMPAQSAYTETLTFTPDGFSG